MNQKASADDIAARLARLFDEGNALRPIARDILALAYFTKDAPLKRANYMPSNWPTLMPHRSANNGLRLC